MEPLKKMCPKCEGEMLQGHTLDATYGGVLVGRWVEGAPKKSFWGGLAMRNPYAFLPIAAFRCEGCGFLEFYAGAEFAPK